MDFAGERRGATIVRSRTWAGLAEGDPVVVNAPKELRQQWVFVAHGRNETTGEEWVEVRGGRPGEGRGRSFRPELIYPIAAKRGLRVTGQSLQDAPQLSLSARRRSR
ncbi:MAG: hypothetical protein KGJ92_03050 [Actinomycetales bacterium]|nr:hypothetical protein [Actinomycetales bacterium]